MTKSEALNLLSAQVNDLYGYEGEIPRINYGPCGIFSYLFYKEWKKRFEEKLWFCFAITKDLEECDHIFLLFEDGTVFDGGNGTHSFSDYDRFFVVIMKRFDLDLLDRMAYGLDRTFPRFCPKFDRQKTQKIIVRALKMIEEQAKHCKAQK